MTKEVDKEDEDEEDEKESSERKVESVWFTSDHVKRAMEKFA